MTCVGITGHQRLAAAKEFGDAERAWSWVREELSRILLRMGDPLIGLSSMAAGADQVFAEVVLQLKGKLEIILPFDGYERLLGPADLERFQELRGRAHVVSLRDGFLVDEASRNDAYFQAGRAIVDRADLILAVWEGRHGKETDRIVDYAHTHGRPLTILDPLRREVGPFKG